LRNVPITRVRLHAVCSPLQADEEHQRNVEEVKHVPRVEEVVARTQEKLDELLQPMRPRKAQPSPRVPQTRVLVSTIVGTDAANTSTLTTIISNAGWHQA
jgi:hypothetical protein